MKRIVLTVASSAMLALAMPGIAAANHHARHHAPHHARHASAHARHVHAKHASVVTLGTLAPPTAPTAPTTPPPPAPKTSAPVTPTPCTPEQIGTVVSFENETLTIELCDKSTYTGEVTEGTEIKCRAGEKSEEGKVHNDEDSYLTKGEGNEEEDDCSTTLVKGAKIYGAELAFTSYGPIWEKVGLLE
jgi:hypothetical protein